MEACHLSYCEIAWVSPPIADLIFAAWNTVIPSLQCFGGIVPITSGVLGLHEIFRTGPGSQNLDRLHEFIEKCRALRALVVLTTTAEWASDSKLDYLVDLSLDLSLKRRNEESAKPERLVSLVKARHQLSAIGSHGINISGSKGLRFSPQVADLSQ